MMKLVIIEGPDNTGKTTVINELIGLYDNVHYIHCQKPKSKDPIKAALEQQQNFEKLIKLIKALKEHIVPQLVILDRSWIGEYVYGCKYRGNGDEYVTEMIEKCYSELYDMKFSSPWFEYYTILLTVDNPEFCGKNDDGKSLSKADIDNVKDEVKRFDDIFSKDINKSNGLCKVIVNNGMKFRPKEDILNDVLKIINYHTIG